MKDHEIIGKLMGICPSQKDLIDWVNSIWKRKGKIDLKLGSKGFFIMMFACIEYRDKVLE
jgi:hypothetical protein